MSSAQGIRAGRAFVEIAAVDQFSRVFDAAEMRVRTFAAGAFAAARDAAAPGLAILGPLGAATAHFAAFDDQMRKVGAMAGGTEAELQRLTATAAELGRTTSYTAAEVAALMVELARGGFNPQQIEDTTKAVLNLARASDTEASVAAEILISTLHQFGMAADQSARVADVLAMAANRSAVSVETLGESLEYAGPVAKQLGLSLEDTVALLAQLGNFGIKGSEAGTALRRIGILAATNGKKLQELFGVTNVDAAGNVRPLVDILDAIGASLKNVSNAEAVAKLEEAFGILGITAANVLANTGSSVRGLADDLNNAGGTSAETAAKMDAGIGGAMRRFASAFEGVTNAIGKADSGALQMFGDAVSAVMVDLAQWIGENQELVVSLAAVGAVLMAFAGAMLAVGLAAKTVLIALLGLKAMAIVALLVGKLAVATAAFAGVLRAWSAATKIATLAMTGLNTAWIGSVGKTAAVRVAVATLGSRLIGTAAATAAATAATVAMNTAQAATPIYATASAAAVGTLRGAMGSLQAMMLGTAAVTRASTVATVAMNTAQAAAPAYATASAAASAALRGSMGSLSAITIGTATATRAAAVASGSLRASMGSLTAIAAGTAAATRASTVATVAMNTAQKLAPMHATAAAASFAFLRGSMVAMFSPSNIGAKLAGLFGSAWKAAGVAAKGVWLTVLAPVAIFIVKAALVIAIIGGIGAALYAAAKRAGTFGELFALFGRQFSLLVGIVKTTFAGITTAIKGGNYAAAVNILWAGIKAAFWVGVESVWGVWEYFLTDGLSEIYKFGKSLLAVLWDTFKAIPGLLMDALSGTKSLAEALADILSGDSLDFVGAAIRSRSDNARRELSELVGQQDAAAVATANLAKQQERLNDARKAASDNQAASDTTGETLGAGATEEQRQQFSKNAAELARLEQEQAQRDAAAENSKAIAERTQGLKAEAIEAAKGADAAERLKFELAGATKAELEAYDQALSTKKSAEMAASIEERIKQLQAEQMELERGEDAAERFRMSLAGATAAQLAALEAAQQSKKQADERQEQKDDAAALTESLRTPAEIFADEMRKVAEAFKRGDITDETARRAAERAKADLDEANNRGKGAGQKMSQLASEGSFDGFALSRMMNPNGGDAQKRIANATEENVKATNRVDRSIKRINTKPTFKDGN